MNLDLYRIFYLVAKTGNITKASLELNISQPAVTKHIKNLEGRLGSPLFIRTPKGVILNEVGKDLFISVKQALSFIDEAENKVKKLENLEKGTITIGISTNLTKYYLIEYINDFRKLYPNIIISIKTDPTSELIKNLKLGLIDFIIAKLPNQLDAELEYKVLGEINDIFVVNKDYKHLMNKKINIKDILNQPILLQELPSNSRRTIDKFCKDNNIIINTTMNIASSNLLIEFVKNGYGIGFVSKQYIEEELNNNDLFELDITPKIKENKFGIITLKNNNLTFSSRKFVNLITK